MGAEIKTRRQEDIEKLGVKANMIKKIKSNMVVIIILLGLIGVVYGSRINSSTLGVLFFHTPVPREISFLSLTEEKQVTSTETPTRVFIVTPTFLNMIATESSTPTKVLVKTKPLPTMHLLAFNPNPNSSDYIDAYGVPMRLIPAGKFTMGGNSDGAYEECTKYRADCQRDGFVGDNPTHQVYLDAFYMDKYEITNVLYKACVDTGRCKQPKKRNSFRHASYYDNSNFDNYPVIYVDWNMAKTYCEWRDASLPTEAQWEKSSRGVDRRTYSWGEGEGCDKANYMLVNSGCARDVTEVGSYTYGQSPYGIYDLVGNVWEWTSDWYLDTYYQISPLRNPLGPDSGKLRVLRGGSWMDNKYIVRSVTREGVTPIQATSYIGFRCVRSLP